MLKINSLVLSHFGKKIHRTAKHLRIKSSGIPSVKLTRIDSIALRIHSFKFGSFRWQIFNICAKNKFTGVNALAKIRKTKHLRIFRGLSVRCCVGVVDDDVDDGDDNDETAAAVTRIMMIEIKYFAVDIVIFERGLCCAIIKL